MFISELWVKDLCFRLEMFNYVITWWRYGGDAFSTVPGEAVLLKRIISIPNMEIEPIKSVEWSHLPIVHFNGAAVELWEWITDFVSHFNCHVITYPCWD